MPSPILYHYSYLNLVIFMFSLENLGKKRIWVSPCLGKKKGRQKCKPLEINLLVFPQILSSGRKKGKRLEM